jgi:hypothetical protein
MPTSGHPSTEGVWVVYNRKRKSAPRGTSPGVSNNRYIEEDAYCAFFERFSPELHGVSGEQTTESLKNIV